MARAVLLVRHTQVARAWQGRCYGRSDMGLSREGAAHARALAPGLSAWRPDVVLHSGLRRARVLADATAALAGVATRPAQEWQERDFGCWEGRSWASVYRAAGNAMEGMVDDPDNYRPGSGETTSELAARALAAYHGLPSGRVIVVTHGGPIAAIIGTLQATPVHDWPALVPAPGRWVEL
jgi:broad specificity phosphatase PhoE